MSGTTKYPVLDPAFLAKMIAECRDDEERGMVFILHYSGMHGSCLTLLTKESLFREGEKTYLQWHRTKNKKTMRCLLPKERLSIVEVFLNSKKKTIQCYNNWLKQMGKRAGFDGISTMTFRHNRCLRAATEEGYSLLLIPQVMGCSMDVVARNYSKLKEDQLSEQNINKE
jgi:hypothetical protein